MDRPRISVIVPALNEAERIGACLECLQRIPVTEIIVSDGGSDDGTPDICRSFTGVTVVRSPRGRGRQLNAGAARASGEVLLFLHADTLLEPRVVDDLGAVLAAGRHWGCCTLAFDEEDPLLPAVAAASNWRARHFSECYGDQGIYCTADWFQAVGGFPEFPLMEDLEFSHRLRRRERAWVLPGRVITSARRFRAGGTLRTLLKMQGLKALYALGVSPTHLARWYHPGAKERR